MKKLKQLYRYSYSVSRYVLLSLFCTAAFSSPTHSLSATQQFSNDVSSDYTHYYSSHNLWSLTQDFALTAIMANTHFDQGVRDWYQTRIRNTTSNNIAKTVKPFGSTLFPVTYVGTMLVSAILPQRNLFRNTVGRWAYRSTRALLVGLPPMWLLQVLTGSYRPDEHKDSHWHPFVQDHGVSGHSFMGAVPFITAAQMVRYRWLKGVLYAASTMTGLSRVNDDKHYFSQIFMGWWMAYHAVSSVSDTEAAKPSCFSYAMLPLQGGAEVAAVWTL